MTSSPPASGPGSRTRRDEAAELITRLPLFLSSYAPLFLIIAVRFDDPTWVRPVSAALVLLGIASVVAVLRAMKQTPTTDVTVVGVKDAGAEAGGYLATYVLPFVPISTPNGKDMIGYGIFLLVLAVIYVRSELLQINPVVYLLLRRIVKVRVASGEDVYVIVRERPRVGQVISIRSFAGIRIESKGA